jgi:glutaredoxin-related protein
MRKRSSNPGNPFVKKARKLSSAKGFCHEYLEFGGYFSQWRRRTALKMWTGWPTFPMVFHRGVLIGGAQDLERWLGSLSAGVGLLKAPFVPAGCGTSAARSPQG